MSEFVLMLASSLLSFIQEDVVTEYRFRKVNDIYIISMVVWGNKEVQFAFSDCIPKDMIPGGYVEFIKEEIKKQIVSALKETND